jgi:hypothetical protein
MSEAPSPPDKPRLRPVQNPTLLALCVLAVIGGGLAAMALKPKPTGSPTEVSVRIPEGQAPDLRVLQERSLEGLIQDAAGSTSIRSLPGFEPTRGQLAQAQYGWVQDRLLEPGVPGALRLTLARALPRRGTGGERADALLQAELREGRVAEAVEILTGRGSVRRRPARGCGCWVAVYKASETWLLMGTLDGGPAPEWAPKKVDGGWSLGVRGAADGDGGDGPSARGQVIPHLDPPWQLFIDDGVEAMMVGAPRRGRAVGPDRRVGQAAADKAREGEAQDPEDETADPEGEPSPKPAAD